MKNDFKYVLSFMAFRVTERKKNKRAGGYRHNSIAIDVHAVRRLCSQLCLFIPTTEMAFILTEKI